MIDGDRLTVGDDADDYGRKFLEARINEHNAATTGIRDGAGIAFFVRDERDAVVAGLSGWTWGDCLYVEYLWVHEDRRRRGYGTRLLAAAEDEARARGCHQVALTTHSFQAPDFYRRLGYEVYGTLDDYPAGHRQYHLKKRLP